MKKYIVLPVIVLIAAAINAYRIDNSLVRAWDTLFGLGPLIYALYHVLRHRTAIDGSGVAVRRALLHGIVVQCVLAVGALSVTLSLWRLAHP